MLLASDLATRFLIVEDDPISALVAQRSLAALGVQADLATNGEEALRLHRQNPYGVMLCDWMMPGMSGIELCRRLRQSDGAYVYFLLCSSREDRTIRLEAYDAGVDDFLSKPLDHDELRARLQVARRILGGEEILAGQRDEMARQAKQTADLNDSLKVASRRFEDLFNGLPVACFTFDPTGCIHEWNRAAEESFGVPAFDTLMHPVWEVFGSNDEVWSPKRCAQVFLGRGEDQFDWTYHGTGVPRHFACRIIALRDRAGDAVGAVCASVDVTERKRAEMALARDKASLEESNARLHDLAANDGLTGLWNRRSLLIDLEAALENYARQRKPFSLVLLDIDRFKLYNDTFGHPAGDEVLRRFAKILRTSARASERPARYGGEEFAIVLHDVGAAKGLAAAERFRKAVERGDWIERDVTCSLGVATVGENGATAEALIAAADVALYSSKQHGRNRCTHASALPNMDSLSQAA